MVYEEIEASTTKHERAHPAPELKLPKKSTITLYRPVLPTCILTTCRLVHQEATPIFLRKLRELANEPVRFCLDWDAADTLILSLSTLPAYAGDTASKPSTVSPRVRIRSSPTSPLRRPAGRILK
jgi:hypothetical protein